jgi:hypothetical protein
MSEKEDLKNLAMVNRELWSTIWAARHNKEGLDSNEERIIAQEMEAHTEYEWFWNHIEELGDYQFDPESEVNPFLHVSFHVTLERQLQANDPPCVRTTLDRLLARGDDPHESKHAIMNVFVQQLWKVLSEHTKFDVKRYCRELAKL